MRGDEWPARYEVRVDGILDGRWSEWFGGLKMEHHARETVLSGTLPDQPALHGVLDKLRDLGLSVTLVRRLPPAQERRTPMSRPTPLQRLFARGYDWAFDQVDAHGGGEYRRQIAVGATGMILEIGAGTGRNLPLYRNATEVVALEPDPGMLARAQEAARRAPIPVELMEAYAEDLPFSDGSFDTVVATYVLCTVSDPDQALSEVRRVLRPGGTLRFLEHVRAPDPRLARWQDRLERPWGWVFRGDHPNRDTVAAIASTGLRVVCVEAFDFKVMPPLVRPLVIGVAERSRQVRATREGTPGSERVPPDVPPSRDVSGGTRTVAWRP